MLQGSVQGAKEGAPVPVWGMVQGAALSPPAA